jgi:hypothetical protein
MAAVEQAGIEMFLKLLDLESHGRLRHEQHLGGLREGQLLGDGVKYLKPAIRHE